MRVATVTYGLNIEGSLWWKHECLAI